MVVAKKHVKIVKKRMSTIFHPHKFHAAFPGNSIWNTITASRHRANGRSRMTTHVLTLAQARSASIVTKATPTNALMPIGASQKVLTIGYGGDSRDKLLCHRYVAIIHSFPVTIAIPQNRDC